MSISVALYQRFYLLTIVCWLGLVAASAWWGWGNSAKHVDQLARSEALANFNKDVGFRLWATSHGGVYVPVTERTPPNRYLEHIPERDIETPSGKKLTLMNPAYMVRQLHEDFAQLYGIQGRITSLKLLNPHNIADEWEAAALRAFETGAKEVFEYQQIDGTPYLRLMRPLVTQQGCLKCHEHQGYKVGDVRGGVGVNVPLTTLYRHRRAAQSYLVIQHLVVGLLGLGMIIFAGRRLGAELGRRIAVESEMRQTQQQLQRSESQLRLLMNSATEGMIGTDEQGICTFVNHAAVAILGVSEASVLGADLHQFLRHERAVDHQLAVDCPLFQAAMAGEVVHREETQLCGLRGEGIPLEYWLHPIRDGDDAAPVGVICTFIDISERVVAQQQLQATLSSLDDTVRQRTSELEGRIAEVHRTRLALFEAEKLASMGRMVAGLAHEINTPLGIAVGGSSHISIGVERLSQLLRQDEVSEEEILPLMSGIEAAAKLTLTNLQRSAALVGRMRHTVLNNPAEPPHRLSVSQTLQDCLWMQELVMQNPNISTHIHCQEGVEWFGRAQELCQVISSLLENSLKHGFGDPQQHYSIDIDATQQGDELVILFQDDGTGIDEALRPHLFEPFAGGMRTGAGSGLGLFITFNLVTVQMHGSITYEAREGGGTLFTIRLPVSMHG